MAEKILVVDDDQSTIKIVESILTSQGYSILVAGDGLDALVKIKKEQPVLVVLDVMMPEINGYDVCYQLRFNKDFERIPILLLTVRQQEIDESIAKRVNIEYLHKPVNAKKLLEKVEYLLNKGTPKEKDTADDKH